MSDVITICCLQVIKFVNGVNDCAVTLTELDITKLKQRSNLFNELIDLMDDNQSELEIHEKDPLDAAMFVLEVISNKWFTSLPWTLSWVHLSDKWMVPKYIEKFAMLRKTSLMHKVKVENLSNEAHEYIGIYNIDESLNGALIYKKKGYGMDWIINS
jgi:hypothetical protein